MGESCGGSCIADLYSLRKHQRRLLDAPLHDVPVQRPAQRSAKRSLEMRRTGTGDAGKMLQRQGLTSEVVLDVVDDTFELFRAELSSRNCRTTHLPGEFADQA